MNVYLDYAATAPLRKEALEAMTPYLRGVFGNPDSLHAEGREAAHAVMRARDRIAAVLGVSPAEVYFTSGGTEADNWAVRKLGAGDAALSAIEHAAVLSSLPMRKEGGSIIPVHEDGIVRAAETERTMSEGTGLVAVMAVNNETGCIQPIGEISDLVRRRGAVLFCDCVQAACTQDLKSILSHADAISLSAHKLGGPKGVGALVVKRGCALRPLIAGGEQERSLRGGTLNVAGIVGFAEALVLAQAEREEFSAHTGKLRALFESLLLSSLGEEVTVDGSERAPNISHLTFARGGDWLADRLDLSGVSCSAGAACSAHAAQPSHVLLAMGRTPEEAKRGARFSFGRETTEADVRLAAERIVRLMK